MPRPVTAQFFQAALDKQHYPEQNKAAGKRLVNEPGVFCFAGEHILKQRSIPALYIKLDEKAARWATQTNGIPLIPDFKFNAITSASGAIGFECLLAFHNRYTVHLFFNPAEQGFRNYLSLLAKGEVVGFSFFFPGGKMVYASYVSSDPQLQDWAKRNLTLAKSCPPDNDLGSVMSARMKMFWLKRKRMFVLER